MRAKVILIFAVVAAVAAGGLYYVFGVHIPGRERDKAREEIGRWEQRLDKVRTCLLGTDIRSPDPGEALAIHELTTEVDRKACTPAISTLSRGDADDTGIAAVETAWREVDAAVSAVAAGFAEHIDPQGRAKPMALDKLPAALGKLFEADRGLRAAAGMDPPAPLAGARLPTAELIPIKLGDYRVKGLDAWLRPSAGGMVALVERDSTAKVGDPHVQIVFVPGEAPKLMPMQSDVRPSITNGSWGAGPVAGGAIRIGAIDPRGALAADNVIAGKAKDDHPFVIFTVGTAAAGAIAFVPDQTRTVQQVAIARVAGATVTPEPPHEAIEYSFALDPPSRGLVAWSVSHTAQAAIVEPGAATKIVDLGDGKVGQACLTATRAWVTIDGDKFVSVDDKGAAPHVLPDHDMIGCDRTSLLLSRAGHRYTVCTDTCRIAELSAKPLALPALAGGQVIAVAVRGLVLAVWREKGPPLFYALPGQIRPKLVHAGAASGGNIVDVIAYTDDGMVIARAKL